MKKIQLKVGGKDLIAEVNAFNNKEYVAITPICEAIGIAPQKQALRLNSNAQFTPNLMVGHDSMGRAQEMLMLPLEEVGMWLCNINAKRVKEDVRDILIAFQKHCQIELHAAITGMAGIDRVSILERQVMDIQHQLQQLIAMNQQLLNVVSQQQTTIDNLASMVEPMAGVEKHIASIGGKFMAVARGTKSMRSKLPH